MAANSCIDATGNKKLNLSIIIQTLDPHQFNSEYKVLFGCVHSVLLLCVLSVLLAYVHFVLFVLAVTQTVPHILHPVSKETIN